MDDIGKLKFKRGQIKGQLTRAKNYLISLDLENISEYEIQELIVRLERLEPLLSQFEDIQNEIEYFTACQNNSLDGEEAERDEFEKSFYVTISKYKRLTGSNSINSTHSAEGSARIGSIGVEASIHSNNPSNNQYISNNNLVAPQPLFIKLPDVKPPSFNGAFERWLEFRDAYKSMVHENANIPSIQKFYYLKSFLSGEPLELIASIEVCSDNYDIAYSLLTERYENKKCIVHNYIKTLFDMPILNKECHGSLRQLYDTFTKNLRSLKTLGLPTEQWDAMLVYLLTSKFDNMTRRDWESHINNLSVGELPTMEGMSTFLKSKCELLERLSLTKLEQKTDYNKPNNMNPKFPYNKINKFKQGHDNFRSFTAITGSKMSCYFCKQKHSIFHCEAFKSLDIDSRINKINALKLCTNCFDPSHTCQNCEKSKCRVCNKKHNTMIHKSELIPVGKNNARRSSERPSLHQFGTAGGERERRQGQEGGDSDVAAMGTMAGHTMNKNNPKISQVLLSTAVIKLFNDNGEACFIRALLDPGSQSHFITESLVNKLGIKSYPLYCSITGVGETCALSANSKVTIKIGSRLNNYNETISCLVIPKITQSMPVFSFNISNWPLPDNLELADPSFNVSSDIDILLGVGLFYKLLRMEQIKVPNIPVLQNSVLGYIIGGELNYHTNFKTSKVVSCLSIERSLEESLVKFWKIEECGDTSIKVGDNDFCEKYYLDTYKRNDDGSFVVKIPFKESVAKLGQSREFALKQFAMLERRFEKKPELKSNYCEFLNEYKRLGHMTKVEDHDELMQNNKLPYFLPHHAIIKETSSTTRVRVVFDASAKTDNGLSLNEVQHVGPTIQADLFTIVLRFHSYKYVLNADVTKMYRQVQANDIFSEYSGEKIQMNL